MIITTDRIFADHYQFYIFDLGYDHFHDERLAWSNKGREEFGYLTTEKAIYVSTSAHLNDHRLRVFYGETPKDQSYERIFTRNLSVESGTLVISAPINVDEDDVRVALTPGVYAVAVCSNSIGKDMYSYDYKYDENMDDEEYFTHDEFEYYDIYINNTEQGGRVKAYSAVAP